MKVGGLAEVHKDTVASVERGTGGNTAQLDAVVRALGMRIVVRCVPDLESGDEAQNDEEGSPAMTVPLVQFAASAAHRVAEEGQKALQDQLWYALGLFVTAVSLGASSIEGGAEPLSSSATGFRVGPYVRSRERRRGTATDTGQRRRSTDPKAQSS